MSLFSQKTPEGVQVTAKVEEGRDADDPPTHLTIELRRSVQGITVSIYVSSPCVDQYHLHLPFVLGRNTLGT